MAGTATNVTAGKPRTNGAVFAAAPGSTLPTDAVTALDNAFKDLGFLSEDGVTRSRSLSSSNIKEWGGKVVLITEEEDITTIKFKMIEYLNTEVQKVVNGDANVTGDLTNGLAITPGDEMTEHAFVFWQRMRGGVSYRLVVPREERSPRSAMLCISPTKPSRMTLLSLRWLTTQANRITSTAKRRQRDQRKN